MTGKKNRILLGILLAVLLISILAAAAPHSVPEMASAKASLLSLLFSRECQGQTTIDKDSGSLKALLPTCWLANKMGS